jgi:uncharacterized protein (TIGR03382 family)
VFHPFAYDAAVERQARMRHSARFSIGFVLAATLGAVGCQATDLEGLDARAGALANDGAVEGTLVHRIADDFDNGTSRRSVHVTLGQGVEYELAFEDGAEIPPPQSMVRVIGDAQDGVLEVDELEVLAFPPQPLIDPENRPPRRLAAILLFWEGGPQGIGNAEAVNQMFGPDDSTNTFYQENSYGREIMAGDVFGPYAIPEPNGCDVGYIAFQGEQALLDHDHDPSEFQQFMYQFPFIGGCGFGGLANLGAPEFPARDSWYNGSFGCVVRNQEIGHNYGMGHSHSYDCQDADGNDVPFSSNCSFEEYGDPYDPMGGGCDHMNGPQKTFMGWLQECNVVRATSDGLFNIAPFEVPCNGTQALHFPSSDGGRDYWLEYRTDQGLDEYEAVLLRVSGTGGGAPDPYVLDFDGDRLMEEGDSYTDPVDGTTFTIVTMDGTKAVIDLQFEGGGSGDPECLGGGAPVMDSGAIGSLECADGPLPLDVTKPTGHFVYPEDEQWFEPGSDFTIEIEAADERYVTEVELYVDGEPTFKKFVAPWTYDVTNIPEGRYQLGAVARDGPNYYDFAIDINVGTPPDADTSGGDEGDEGDEGDDTEDDGTDEDDEDDNGDEESTGPGIDSGGDEGCGCTTNDGGAPALALFGLAVIGLRRRRR